MLRDKQLCSVRLEDVLEKRRLAQALNAKEFAVLAGVSYSASREWFRLPGFPVFRGVVFWQDFERWRAAQTGLTAAEREPGLSSSGTQHRSSVTTARSSLPPQAARIVAEFG
jgi:hypothetical protein